MRFSWRIVLALLCAALLVGIGFQQQPWLNEQRDKWLPRPVTEGVPPEIVLATTALGGFRGILIDLIWIRAVKLQQQGKYWELVQLYDWMGKLEPHIEDIWEFNAWNMAYNIVAELHDSEERWLWIGKAINLLRERGLKYNPRSAQIAWYLSWLHWQKIGEDNDEHNVYYKHRFALIMNSVFGDFFDDVAPLAEAPETEEELFADRDVRRFRDALKRSGGEKVQLITNDDQIEKAVQQIEGRGGSRAELLPPFLRALEGDRKELAPLFKRLADEDYAAARTKIKAYIRARVLRGHYRLDTSRMLEQQKTHGKMDWRLPDPHAIYWTTRAREFADEKFDKLQCDRIVFYSIKQLYRRGHISFMSENPGGEFITTYNLDYIAHLDGLYRDIIRKYRGKDGHQSFKDGHSSFLKEIVRNLYFANRKAEAVRYYDQLKRDYPSDRFEELTLREWVFGHIKNLVTEYGKRGQIEMFVGGILRTSLLYLGAGDLNTSARHERYARDVWDYYVKDTIDRLDARVANPQFADISRIYNAVLDGILAGMDPAFSPVLIARLKEFLPDEVVKASEERMAVRRAAQVAPRSEPKPLPKTTYDRELEAKTKKK